MNVYIIGWFFRIFNLFFPCVFVLLVVFFFFFFFFVLFFVGLLVLLVVAFGLLVIIIICDDGCEAQRAYVPWQLCGALGRFAKGKCPCCVLTTFPSSCCCCRRRRCCCCCCRCCRCCASLGRRPFCCILFVGRRFISLFVVGNTK